VAIDPDAGQNLTFSIIGGNDRGIFAINPSTGQIRIIDTHKLNIIEYFTYPLLIRVTDNGPDQLFADAVVSIEVYVLSLELPEDDFNTDGNLTNVDASLESEVICNLYPNPSSDYINVEVENLTQEIMNLSIVDLTGGVVYKETIESIEGSMLKQIEINQLSKGSYIVYIQYGENKIMKKFVKF
jgi:hypothetical protein